MIQEGFFKLPNKRTREDVRKALKARSVPVEGDMNLVVATLERRVKKGMLKARKDQKDGPTGPRIDLRLSRCT